MSKRRRKLNPDDPAREAPPPPLAELLGQLSDRRGWSRRLDGAQIHGRWEEIAGADIARHVTPVRLHGGVLLVRAESAAWATQVRYLAPDLVARANEVLGPEAVRTVNVVTGQAHDR